MKKYTGGMIILDLDLKLAIIRAQIMRKDLQWYYLDLDACNYQKI